MNLKKLGKRQYCDELIRFLSYILHKLLVKKWGLGGEHDFIDIISEAQ